MNYQYKIVSEKDKNWIYLLNSLCYHDLVKQQFGKWDEKQQKNFFENKWNKQQYKIIEYSNLSIGVVAVIDKEDHFFLSEILIHPEHQNQGHGTQIISHIIDNCRKIKKDLKLQVLKANHAKNLYQRLGFVKYDETETHYKMIYQIVS
ncbi:MAG: GNAT family N-acetyltransferase [Spirochaetes bacterium]|nr:GNAT family N-acetyltransferase [Spirochaetota bacterium]